ncbi:MAG TPA: ABC transporter permease [Phycisphaerae bacterium]|nr:ABC transporter permease [Phycisphaerae bacterium]
MSFFSDPISLLWRHRHMLLQTTRNDIRARYAGSTLGMAWTALFPLIFLGVYAVVTLVIARMKPAGMSGLDYMGLVFCGLMPFIGFTEALVVGTSSVTSNASLIKNTLFPIELIPVKAVLTSQCTQVVGTCILLLTLAAMQSLSVWAFLLPVVWLTQIFFTIGVVWILSSLNVYFRDLQNIIALVPLILQVISPIAWSAEMIPERMRKFMGINPLYYLITAYQDCLKYGRFPHDHALAIMAILAALFFLCGYWFFTRMKLVFADNV